jgi:hypothetical protein
LLLTKRARPPRQRAAVAYGSRCRGGTTAPSTETTAQGKDLLEDIFGNFLLLYLRISYQQNMNNKSAYFIFKDEIIKL